MIMNWTYAQKILDGSVWVKERSPHCTIDVTSLKTHILHLGNDLFALRATQ